MTAAPARRPLSTYRLQLHKEFRLRDVMALVPYLADLGVGDIYLSPILAARAGSQHGYDVVDPTRINPDVGSMAELEELSALLQQHQMGILLDIVPNHLCISDPANLWWQDVLAHGRESTYHDWFAIDWDTPYETLRNHVALPLLDQPVHQAVESGALSLVQDGDHLALRAGEVSLPVATHGDALNDVEAVLEQQAYRLESWKGAPPELNYRRFFDVNDLIGIRQEVDAVFAATHAVPLDLLRRGIIHGVRVDHIDGLHDPAAYLRRLADASGNAYVVVEKILARSETLPTEWPTAGTTGYDALAMIDGALTSAEGAEALRAVYADFVHSDIGYGETTCSARELLLTTSLATDFEAIVLRVLPLLTAAEQGAVPAHLLRTAMRAVMAALPVYRTYLREGEPLRAADAEAIAAAADAAHRRYPMLGEAPFALAGAILRGEAPDDADESQRGSRRAVALRLQQLTGAVMAKGIEDTTFYRYTPLASLAEVGNDPGLPPADIAAFHAYNQLRSEQHSASLVASTTHDTKRSEDVRARIRGLAHNAVKWHGALRRWHTMNAAVLPVVAGGSDLAERQGEYLLYQTLLGIWPDSGEFDDTLIERVQQYMLKAIREAKWRTSWIAPDEQYEAGWRTAIATLLAPQSDFVADFASFAAPFIAAGRWSGAAALVLKCTIPGVPDVYQGCEGWTDSLVDPDNRRPVDFAAHKVMLQQMDTADVAHHPEAPPFKAWLTRTLLQLRKAQSEPFVEGDYQPRTATGAHAGRVIAFARRWQESELMIVVDAGFVSTTDQSAPTDGTISTGSAEPSRWHNLFDGSVIESNAEGLLPLGTIFATMPIAVLERQ